MLSDEDKKEMLVDAYDSKRKEAFADSKRRVLKPMSWAEYFNFLKTAANCFNFKSMPHRMIGENFKL